MICLLGDIHFNASKDYYRATCEAFLDWFNNWKLNLPSNTLILAGDLVQDSVNGGVVVRYLEKLFQYSRFKEVHIVVGNHDLKKVHSISQLAYDFYRDKPNFYVYDTATEVTIDNHKALFLPYYTGLNAEGLSMVDYYSTIYKNPSFSNDYDLVVGHFCGEDVSFPGAVDCVKNLDKLSGRVCLGHIHTRSTNPSRYLGSVYAVNKSENDSTRAAWILDGSKWYEEKLPVFNEFLTVTYPDPLLTSEALVPIYTVLSCASEANAILNYGNIFIRKITLFNSDSLKKSLNSSDDISSIKYLNIAQLFSDFIATQNLNESIVNKCKALIESP